MGTEKLYLSHIVGTRPVQSVNGVAQKGGHDAGQWATALGNRKRASDGVPGGKAMERE